jgi:LuxR family transcriptional regulator, maltose regulon positive regulatory protein
VGTRLAKICRPILHQPVARERLFSVLDDARGYPLVWIEGPPGAGKTTLLASWLEARHIAAVWYQLDATDADAATFFYYLGLAARPLRRSRKRQEIPLPNSGLSRDLAGFARRYFRILFASLPPGTVIILDNLQELSEDSPLRIALVKAVEEMPQGSLLMLISRDGPGTAFARLQANQTMRVLDADDLKFTLAETRLMLRDRADLQDQDATELHELCQGWAVGLILLMEQRRRGEPPGASGSSPSLQNLFDYFAGEIFDRIAESDQQSLLRLSWLPQFTVCLAVQASGNADAGNLVEGLYRHNLFVDCRRGLSPLEEDCFQFHSLFRAFLRDRAATSLSPSILVATQTDSARLLQASGDIESAFALYVEAVHWDGAADIIHQHAERLLSQGRRQLLREWIQQIPSTRVDDDPWLMHWFGVVQIGVEPQLARSRLERACERATKNGDSICRVFCVAGIVETLFLEYGDFPRLDPWIAILEELVPRVCFPDANAQLRIYAALVGATLQRKGNPPALETYVARALVLLGEADNPNLRIAAATHLLRYGTLVGKMPIARQALEVVLPLLGDADVTPLRRGLCELFVAWFYVNDPQERQAYDAIERIERLSNEHHIRELRRFAAIPAYWLEMSHVRVAEAARYIGRLGEAMSTGNAYDVGCLEGLKTWSHAASGDVPAALRAAHEALRLFDQAGSAWHRLLSRGMLAWAYRENNDSRNAMLWCKEGRDLAKQLNIGVFDVHFDQIEASFRIERGEDVRPLLSRMFSDASTYGTGLPLRFFPTLAPGLCALALKFNIEVSYVNALIRTWNWHPPDSTTEVWPWPVRIYTLGRFELFVEGERVTFGPKAPRKVLALLKALICLGATDVRDRRLISALWSDDEQDTAKAAFDVTLHRLRRLLVHPEAIQVQDGSLRLNPEVCWVDTVALGQLLERPHDRGNMQALLSLYKGNLLPADDDEAWSSSLRERLRRKFVHRAELVGNELEALQEWRLAIDHYQRGLDADNMTEAFYCGLMRCYSALQRPSEAISVYRRMQRLLSVTLGLQPGASSEALYRGLLSTHHGVALEVDESVSQVTAPADKVHVIANGRFKRHA